MATKKRQGDPWESTPYEDADIAAIKALHAGTANEGQQKRALEWILVDACRIRDLDWRPGGQEGDRASSFAAGKRYVGLQIAKLMLLRPKQALQGEGPHAVPTGPPPES